MITQKQAACLFLISAILSLFWAFYLLDQNKNLKEYATQQYNKGYKEYLIDFWVPAIGVVEQIPVKRPNPKLKEKFKG